MFRVGSEIIIFKLNYFSECCSTSNCEGTAESEQIEMPAEVEPPKLANPPDESSVERTGLEPTSIDCAICLQTCVHPARLPCGHIFCFLCLKGIAHQSKRCAMCRQEIPADYLEHPDLVPSTSTGTAQQSLEGGYQWFYEGRNGKHCVNRCRLECHEIWLFKANKQILILFIFSIFVGSSIGCLLYTSRCV